eukprot:3548044-Amphidinium_carterae.1
MRDMRVEEDSFASPSGRHYVAALASYPRRFPKALQGQILDASPGDLIELLACSDGWGFGVELVRRASSQLLMPGARGNLGKRLVKSSS